MNRYKLALLLVILAWFVMLMYVLSVPVKSEDAADFEPVSLEDLALNAALAAADLDKPATEPVTYEGWFKVNASVIPSCEITHYCCEPYEHICGTGDGITSTGVPVTAGWTCAVDPSVIPYGAEIMVDYGDRVEFWKAQDCGGAIRGNHIDLAVETHEEAQQLGVKTATVYWLEVPDEFS